MSIGLSFDWDPEKAARNLAKHGVTFGEAANVLAGGYLRIISARAATRRERRMYEEGTP